MIDQLSKLGVFASYYLKRLSEAATIRNPPDIAIETEIFVQHIFDNTDHNDKTREW